jgi:REP element-mobilizing transposase RayT
LTKEVYHIIWTTYETPKPENRNPHWEELQELYNQIKERGGQVYMPLLIASKAEVKQKDKQVRLSGIEVENTMSYLINLTQKKTDHIAGGNRILAGLIASEKVELLLECSGDKLQQVVGRLKSKSSSALLWNRAEEKHIWSKGFWYAQLLNEISKQAMLNYIKSKNAA